jgi:hypothetical protein
MSEEEIRKAADKFSEKEYFTDSYERERISFGFFHGAKWALENQWHDTRKGDLPYKHTELLDDCEGTVYVFCISKKNTPYADYMLQSSKDGHWFWGKHNSFDCKYWMPIPTLPTLPTKPKTPTI